jgi:hypothetical protein
MDDRQFEPADFDKKHPTKGPGPAPQGPPGSQPPHPDGPDPEGSFGGPFEEDA